MFVIDFFLFGWTILVSVAIAYGGSALTSLIHNAPPETLTAWLLAGSLAINGVIALCLRQRLGRRLRRLRAWGELALGLYRLIRGLKT